MPSFPPRQLIPLLLVSCTLGACAGVRSTVSPEFLGGPLLQPGRHQLHVTLDPAARALTAEDLITLTGPLTTPSVAFYLADGMTIEAVSIAGGPDRRVLPYHRRKPRLPRDSFAHRRFAAFEEMSRYEVDLPAGLTAPLQLTIRYRGRWPEAAGPEQPLTTQGAHLTGGDGWYPLWPDALFTVDLTVDHPPNWEAVSAGRRSAHIKAEGRSLTTWSMAQPTETIDLIAGPYTVTARQAGGIDLFTYFFAGEAALAPAYLDAATDYLTRYSRLLGPYPFSKLAIVETAAPIGAATPSLVLMGRPLVRRHYTQPYGLGHEIVHAWFGNSVMADEAQGNWTEALTTYVANYYTVETEQGEPAAREQRKRMLWQYAVQAPAGLDYPLMHFLHNDSQADAAIGYQKGAFVFHLLRRMMGEEAFFAALRDLTERYRGKRASWNDLRLLCEARSGRSLDWFFLQWVVRAGAPQLTIDQVTTTPLPPDDPDGQAPSEAAGITVAITVRQTPPAYRLPITMQIDTKDRMLEKSMWMAQERIVIDTATAALPARIAVDPDVQLFRRLGRDELPPMLNLTLTEPAFAVLPPDGATTEMARHYQVIADTARARHNAQAARPAAGGHHTPVAPARLILGGPLENRATAELAQPTAEGAPGRLPPGVAIEPAAFTVDGHRYSGSGHALLLSFFDPSAQNRPVTLFYGLSSDAVAPLAPLLFYHGWDSYVVFDQGHAIATGELPAARSPLSWTPPQPAVTSTPGPAPGLRPNETP